MSYRVLTSGWSDDSHISLRTARRPLQVVWVASRALVIPSYSCLEISKRSSEKFFSKAFADPVVVRGSGANRIGLASKSFLELASSRVALCRYFAV